MPERADWFKHPDPNSPEGMREAQPSANNGRETAPYGYPFFEEGRNGTPNIAVFDRPVDLDDFMEGMK